MGETIYIDYNHNCGAFGICFTRDAKVVHTGLEVITENDTALAAEISRLCGMDLFLQTQAPEISLYCVPYLEIFAADGRNGWFALTMDGSGGPVYHIGPDRSPHLAAECFKGLLGQMVSDPDWRQKRLPGGPWSPLPEDPEGRKKLAEALHLPASPSEKVKAPHALPRIFASRAEAEKAFPIQDIWTILRQEKEPRFQVHPMMSPADREGRAFVHYTAWRETYTGLMDPRILEAQTLGHCRKLAQKSSSGSNFVALDRENNDRVVGFAAFSHHARDFVSVSEAGEIISLYVLREFQGLGLGKQLLERCLARLLRPRAALFVLKGNEQAIGFYEHMGFRLTGHEVTKGGLTELEMVLEKETT